MLKLENMVSVKQYAELCGIQNIAVYRRIKKRIITAITIGGVQFIDVEKHPPIKRNPYRQRSPGHPYSTVSAVDENARTIGMALLVTAKQYARKAGVRPGSIYRKIVLKQIEAVVIGDVIFIDEEKYPPSQYVLSRKPARKRWEMS